MFVYYLIQKFKQHIAPFVITIRKILSVVISIFWFNHAINGWQWLGVFVVFLAAVFDFVSEKYCGPKEGAAGHGGHVENKEQPVEQSHDDIIDDRVEQQGINNPGTEIEVVSPKEVQAAVGGKD
jgi:hypothetical protein